MFAAVSNHSLTCMLAFFFLKKKKNATYEFSFSCCKSLSTTIAQIPVERKTFGAIILGGPFLSFENAKNAKIEVLIKKHLYLIAFVDVPISLTGLNYSPISFFFFRKRI